MSIHPPLVATNDGDASHRSAVVGSSAMSSFGSHRVDLPPVAERGTAHAELGPEVLHFQYGGHLPTLATAVGLATMPAQLT